MAIAPTGSFGTALSRAAWVWRLSISAAAAATFSFDSKWLSTVWCDTPAALAIATSVMSSNACSIASVSAAWTIRSRVADIPSARATILYVFRLADFI
jgi:hypothetical protein